LRVVVLFGALAISLGSQSAAQPSSAVATTAPPQAQCEYLLTGPELPQLAPPRASYDDATRSVAVVLHVVRGAELEKHPPYYLATPGRPSVRMTVNGPFGPEAKSRIGAARSDAGEYWRLEAPLPSRASFAVYFDDVWRGVQGIGDRPCSSTFRRLVTSVANGAQLQNEYGPGGLLPIVSLTVPVSTQTLSSLSIPPPSGLRGLDLEQAVRTTVKFRAAWFRPRREADVSTTLDTRRSFDVAVRTSSSAPASLEYRFVIGRADGGAFVVEQFAWSVGEAVGTTETLRPDAVTGPDGSQVLRLATGYGSSVALHLRSTATGLLQIVDATR
jgi:hypothetical protein